MKNRFIKHLLWICPTCLVLVAAAILLIVQPWNQKQDAQSLQNEDCKIYWNVDGEAHRKNENIRFVSSDGYVYMTFAVDGTQERLPVKDYNLAVAIDMMDYCGLVFDENRVVVDYCRVEDFTGGVIANRYYVTAIDGSAVTCNAAANLRGMNVTFDITDETGVYDVGGDGITCGIPGIISVGDRVTVIESNSGDVLCVYVIPYTDPGEVYWNINRKYDSASRLTTREMDITGCYIYKMIYNGEIVEVKTKDVVIASQMDSYNAPCMGLTFDENGYVIETRRAHYVTGGRIFGSYSRVLAVDENQLYARKLTGTGIGTEYIGTLASNCKIINVTSVGEQGSYTELRIGDQIHGLTDADGKLCYVFITNRVCSDEYDLCWNFGYVSGSKVFSRTTDKNGVYQVELAMNGKKVIAWTDDREKVEFLDGSRFRGVKLSEDNEILDVIASNYVYGGSYFCSWYYITDIDGDKLTVTSGGKNAKVLTGTLSPDVEVFNTSNRLASHPGEASSIRVGDRIYAQNDLYGEIRAIYIVERFNHTDIFYNLNRKWSSTNNATTRTPDADGLYSFLMAKDGQQVTVKTASLEVANAIDSQVANVVGLIFEDGLAVRAMHAKETEECKGGVGVSYEYVKFISGRQITTYKPSTGKNTTFTVSRDALFCNVSNDYENYRGEKTELRVGDQIHCLKSLNGETNYVYITKRGLKETTHSCQQAEDGTVWYEWSGQTAIEKSGFYLLTKDATRSSRITITADMDVTICLNGHTLTCTDRVFSIYGKLTLCDHCENGNYGGSIITKYSNKVDANGTVTTKVYGGLAYLYNEQRDVELNIYGGNYIHEGSATNGGLIFASASASSGYTATVNLYDGKLSGGTVTGLGGGVYLTNGAIFNFHGGTVEKCAATGNGAGASVNNGTFNMFGGTITKCTTKASGGAVNVDTGTFKMTNGNLTGNTANEGGNLRIGKNGTVKLSDGARIQNGSAKNGGNITMFGKLYVSEGAEITGGSATNHGSAINLFSNYDDADCVLNMTGGIIEGSIRYDSNKGSVKVELLGGKVDEVIMYNSAVTNLYIGGNVQVQRVHLESGKSILIHKDGLKNASVGVSMDDTSKPFAVVTTAAEETCFHPYDEQSYDIVSTDRALYLKAKVKPHAHCVCGGTLSGAAQDAHSGCESVGDWTALTKENFVVGGVLKASSTSGRANFSSSGRYYLAEDISTSYVLEILKGTDITLCLNGHALTSTATGNSAIRLSAKLSICDCAGGGKLTSATKKAGGMVLMLSSGADSAVGVEFNLYGGTLMMTDKDYTANAGVIQVGNSGSNPAVFNMYGGTITGGTANKGGNILIGTAAATMNMYGGSVTGGSVKTNDSNTDRNRGGNIYVSKGTLNVYGGSITDGMTTANDPNPGLGGDIYLTGGKVQFFIAMDDLDIANDGTGEVVFAENNSGVEGP